MVNTLLKICWHALINLDGVLIVVLLGLAARAARRKSSLRARTVVLCLLPLVVTQWTPAGRWLLICLEQRFPHEAVFPGGLPEDLTGLVLLGGSFILPDSEERGETVHNYAASRLFESIAVARRYPKSRIVFTGNPREVRLASRVFEEQGVAPARITYESGSFNTRDNARNTFELVRPQADEKWALLTSALHMPRAVGLFRGAGWRILPYPVNYLTSGRFSALDWLSVPHAANAHAWRAAAHELAGLLHHFVTGDSPDLWPGP